MCRRAAKLKGILFGYQIPVNAPLCHTVLPTHLSPFPSTQTLLVEEGVKSCRTAYVFSRENRRINLTFSAYPREMSPVWLRTFSRPFMTIRGRSLWAVSSLRRDKGSFSFPREEGSFSMNAENGQTTADSPVISKVKDLSPTNYSSSPLESTMSSTTSLWYPLSLLFYSLF